MRSAATPEIRVGIGGWVYPPWRGAFYPEGLAQKRELEYASSRLTSIEINGTYRRTQKPESFAKWHDETPDDFVFALKGPMFATNRRILAEAGESVERFFQSGVARLGDKLGPIVWQFMPTKAFDGEDFEGFLSLLPRRVEGRAIRHAVEVRHDSFRTPEFVALARKHAVAIVLSADAKYPQIADLTGPFVYLRIMGTSRSHANGYGDAALDAWAERVRLLSSGGIPADLETVASRTTDGGGRDVFLYVIGGFKVRNPLAAMALIERLR